MSQWITDSYEYYNVSNIKMINFDNAGLNDKGEELRSLNAIFAGDQVSDSEYEPTSLMYVKHSTILDESIFIEKLLNTFSDDKKIINILEFYTTMKKNHPDIFSPDAW